jgi:hypothetical protein
MFRRWGIVGGPGVNFWMLGPELDRAFLLVEKWAIGEDGGPPICPPELMLRWPTSVTELRTRPDTVMLDGTKITARHASRAGKNLTARNVREVWWTEAATSNSVMDFVRARGRVVQSRGHLYLDFVPEPANWVDEAIIDAAEKEAEEIAEARARGDKPERPTYHVASLDICENPWVAEEDARAFIRDLERIDVRIAAREGRGESRGDLERLFDMFDRSRHTFDLGAAMAPSEILEALKLEDITPQASIRWLYGEHEWLIGADINANPHTSLIGKITVRKGTDPRNPKNWRATFLDTLQVWGKDSEQAAVELAEYRGGRYKGAGVLMDATSTGERHNAGGHLNANRNIRPREAYERAGFEVVGPEHQLHDASAYRNPTAFDGSLVCRASLRHDRVDIDRVQCKPFVAALRRAEAEPDGVTPKKSSNTNQDRHVAAFVDVFRYFMWPFFSLALWEEKGEPLKVRINA